MGETMKVADHNGILHDVGCPAVADDESDYEHLANAGECVCGAIPRDYDRAGGI